MITFKINEMTTQETKAKIYSLYYGQKILKHADSPGLEYTVGEAINIWDCATRGYYLHLKSLSDITDEDALGVSKYYTGNIPGGLDKTERKILIKAGREIALSIKDQMYKGYSNRCALLYAFDYLRSKGYALPAFGLSVEQLIESGVFTLIKQ